ncbi:hypothetical protein SK128_013595, partial [Halocaridina rubra]
MENTTSSKVNVSANNGTCLHTYSGLLIYFIGHTYIVIVLGSLCNLIAIWCIATNKKISRSMKILLGNIFITQLLYCLVTAPIVSEFGRRDLYCRLHELPYAVGYFMACSAIFSDASVFSTVAAVSIIRLRAFQVAHQQVKLPVVATIILGSWCFAIFNML